MRRLILIGAIHLAACNGDLHPFASGGHASGDGNGDGSEGIAGDATSAADDADASDTDALDPSEGAGDIVYVRCPRTRAAVDIEGDVLMPDGEAHVTRTLGYADVYDELPRVGVFGGFTAPCDLVLAHASGDEEVLYDCTSASSETLSCAALEPAVANDGRHIAYSVWWGSIEHTTMKVTPKLLDVAAEGGDETWVPLPNASLTTTEAELHVLDLVTGEDVVLPHVPGTFDTAPAFLADGRIAFTSTRAGLRGTAVHVGQEPWSTSSSDHVSQLHSVAIDGRDLRRLGPHGLAGEFNPLQLVDGRIAFVSRQLFGMLPYRWTNGSNGVAGAIGASYHVYAEDPDGARLTPLFGQHTHIVGSPELDHVASQRLTQASDGRIFVSEGGGSFGAGTIYAFEPRDDGLEGLSPTADIDIGNVFRPADLAEIVAWGGRGAGFSGPMPAPEVHSPAYDDPLVHTGFVRDPEGLADGALLLVWTKGACSGNANAPEELFGPEPPPLTSGTGAFAAMNALEVLGRDSPGCDAGIYRLASFPSSHPSDLELVIDRAEYHEIMPRLVGPYVEQHGSDAPESIAPAHLRADEPEQLPTGTPFALFGASSLLLRETRSMDGHPFAGEIQWALQGTDVGDYTDDEVCGLRLLAVQPNRADEPDALRLPAGLRTLVLAEIAARKRDADGELVLDSLDQPDTSVRVRVPAEVPLLVQGIDCEGRTLSTSQTPISLQPGEDLRCDGCHVRSQPGLPFSQTAAALPEYAILAAGQGAVQLLAGSDDDVVATHTVEGWGAAFEFERDVWPILQSRCVECHASTDAAAGLVLDVPGIEAGSTWWRLVADIPQVYVPADLVAPGGSLRKPQLTKYVRFMNARGSLLYWKAANERTDGRTDAQFADDAEGGFADVDFGLAHPTDITRDELAVLARWIDTGAAAGPGVLADATPPTLSVHPSGANQLAIGTVDVGSGIDPDSLAICSVGATGPCSAIEAPLAAEAGVVLAPVPVPTSDVELRVSVRDLAGNEAVVQRTFTGIDEQGPDTDSGDEPAEDDASGDANDDASSGIHGDAVDAGHEGCGCTETRRSHAAAIVIVIASMLRRRRRSRA